MATVVQSSKHPGGYNPHAQQKGYSQPVYPPHQALPPQYQYAPQQSGYAAQVPQTTVTMPPQTVVELAHQVLQASSVTPHVQSYPVQSDPLHTSIVHTTPNDEENPNINKR